MSKDRLSAIADRIVAARRPGARIELGGDDIPRGFEEGFTSQAKVAAALGPPAFGGKWMALPNGPVISAPILQPGGVPAGGTWTLVGKEPAGIELEIAFRMGRDVPAGASRDEVLD